jgi:cell wall-associated NlpC family hydrolase
MIADSSVHYTVKQGDWLSKIAPRFGESWQQLYGDNRQIVGANPDLIRAGMVLRVGHHAGSGSAVSHTAEAKSSTTQTTAGAVAVAYARSKIGSHYRWGATGPNVFDCSGLVYAAWRRAGVSLPRTADQMWHHLPRVSMSHLQLGDIIAFGYHSSYADHVGIYAGNGRVIDTSSHRPYGGVGIQSLKSRTGGGAWHVLGAVRPTAHVRTASRAVSFSVSVTKAASSTKSSPRSVSGLIGQVFGGQAPCAANIVKRESGFSVTATNPDGAYGLPQAYPASKMSAAGPDWRTNPATQLRWMRSYVNARYGGACNAWAYWQGHGAY